MDNYTKKIQAKRILIYLFLVILTLLNIFPFWIVLVNSTRSANEIQRNLGLIPSGHLFSNWRILMDTGFGIFTGFRNSFIIAAGSTLLAVYFSALTAYGLIAYRFKGRQFMFAIILALIMIPGQISMVGFFRLVSHMNLLGSFIPLIVPAIVAPPTVFFLKQYLETVYHRDLADAARIDGASELRIYHRIMLPLMKPGLATMAIFAFVTSWNNFLMPLMLLASEQSRWTVPIFVQSLTLDMYRTEFGAMYLGLSLSIMPLILMYAFLSRYIIGGVTAGGVKQ